MSDATPDEVASLLPELVAGPLDEVFRLPERAEVQASFAGATPFPHLVIDDFLQPRFAEAVRGALLEDDHLFARSFNDDIQRNKTISTGDDVPLLLQGLATKLGSAPFLRWLEGATGMSGLIGDPYFNTEVGYYHIVGPGGVLASHIDHSHHSSLHIPHVLNVVLYISPDWQDSYGGHLHLFDAKGRDVDAAVSARFNRAIVFASNPVAYHGVEPLAPTAPSARHSLYFAYYAVPRADSVVGTPGLQGRIGAADGQDVAHPTYFVVPGRDLLRRRNWPYLRTRAELVARMVLPPVIPAAVRRLRRGTRP